MKVGRIYEIDMAWHAIQRLWSLETVFSSVPNIKGRQKTLRRLKQHCKDVNEVIIELENELKQNAQQELEDESWLE